MYAHLFHFTVSFCTCKECLPTVLKYTCSYMKHFTEFLNENVQNIKYFHHYNL